MKIHTTNCRDAFITVAEDCPAVAGELPPQNGGARSVARIQFDMISRHPYRYTSDDVIFHCYAVKKDIPKDRLKEERTLFFSKGQPCLRASPLTKRYGWGVHSDAEGKVALFGRETKAYKAFCDDKKISIVKAMRSKKA